jgi:hypothetical protein
VEVQTQGLNPRDNQEEVMGLVKLGRLLQDVEVDRIIEAGWLATLVRDMSVVLEDLGLSRIPRIP